jgi:RNA-directed DNA polymerase
VSGPGNRAPKTIIPVELTPSRLAEGHGAEPKRMDVAPHSTPGSKSSARSHMIPAREPGDLDGASPRMVRDRQLKEDEESQASAATIEKSDEGIVPKKHAKTWVTPVERVEGRPEAKGKSTARNTSPAQKGKDVATTLRWIGERAKSKPEEQLTNLLNHIKAPLLKEAYQRLRKDAAPGVDDVTWQEYGERLGERLCDLEGRIHRGSYHPQPVRRVHIPKGDGRTRPLGIPTLEDKLVQQAVRMVLEPIYEAMFVGLSYGFRPGRSQHDALDALAVAIGKKKVSWVLDADIRSYFDTIDHGWLQKFLEHRIGDTRMVRLIMKMVRAGVMEDGELHEVQEGAPQGGSVSPLLSNIYLHYVFDLWVIDWRRKQARGEMYAVRYADDFVMAFQHEQDARAAHQSVGERFAKFGLELHSEKTRVLEFGRFARGNRERRGLGKPETFDFLGFTHIVSTSREGKFQLKRRTSRKKRQAKLVALTEECRRRRHDAVTVQHAWLSSVLEGHYRYYAVPTNYRALGQYCRAAAHIWHRSLQRRSQRAGWTGAKWSSFEERFPLPSPRICHPWPEQRFALR